MSRQVNHDGRGSFQVRFAFDRRLVDLVKRLPTRRWVADAKYWMVPENEVVALVDLLHPEGFSLDEVTVSLYRSYGGRLPVDGGGLAAHPGPGLFDALGPATTGARSLEQDDYTVARLNREVCAVLEEAFPTSIWLVGEISGFNKNQHKRHVSFNLVERTPDGTQVSQVVAILFEDARRAIEHRLADADTPFRLEDEIEVRLRVRVELYDAWGQYRVRVEDLDVHYTLGQAARRREEIVRRLAAEGLLERNQALPFPDWPLKVGIVTSLGSDAYNDVLRTLQESGFAFEVTVHGARVQGRQTEPTVLAALDWFRERAERFDVLLVVRGGGSRTDLAWFDSEVLGRAVAVFPVPVVVGIGHEQDFSVLDAVGWRAKTPTAAASVIVERVRGSLEVLEERGRAVLEAASDMVGEARRAEVERALRLVRATRSRLYTVRRELFLRAVGLPRAAARLLVGRRGTLEQSVRQLVQGSRRDLSAAAHWLTTHRGSLKPRSLRRIALEAERAEARARRLHLLEPRRVIERGYAILREADGKVVTDATRVPRGSRLRAELRQGALRLLSDGTESGEGGS